EDANGARTADLALAFLRRVMNWHAARDDDFRSPIIKGMGRWNAAANARARVLDDDELRLIWKEADSNGYFGSFVKFLLLTGARRGEVAGLTWAEIDGDLWTLPASRNKTKVELARPLSKAALAVVDAQPRNGSFIFSFDGDHAISYSRAT